MKLKFRPTVEHLDSRDLPSGNPLDPLVAPPTLPPTQASNPSPVPPADPRAATTPGGTNYGVAAQPVDSQLVALILNAAATNDSTALTAYIQSLMPAEEPTSEGGAGDGEPLTPSEGSGQPMPGGQPVPVVATPFVAFDPVPAATAEQLAAARAELVALGGRAPTDTEVAEIASLKLHRSAGLQAISRLAPYIATWKGVVAGVKQANEVNDTSIQALKLVLKDAQKAFDDNPSAENLERLNKSKGGLAALELTMDGLEKLLVNAQARLKYLNEAADDFVKEIGRIDLRIAAIREAIKNNLASGNALLVKFPKLRNLNGAAFTDPSKPLVIED